MVALNSRLHAGEVDRRPVLLLHGLGSRADDWALQVAALTPTFPVLTVDLRGHGDSPTGSGWPSMADLAGDVVGVLEGRDIESAHLVGLSLGAAVALQLALDGPARVRTLTLVNGFARLDLDWRRRGHASVRLLLLLLGRMDGLADWVAGSLFPDPEQEALRVAAAERLAGNDRGAYLRALWAVRGFDVVERLEALRAPTLVVVGDDDRILPSGPKRGLAQRIPGAKLATISGSGHATPLDAPECFNRLLLSFLERGEGFDG